MPVFDHDNDNEMYAYLWGVWLGYTNGSLDTRDWETGGRQAY